MWFYKFHFISSKSFLVESFGTIYLYPYPYLYLWSWSCYLQSETVFFFLSQYGWAFFFFFSVSCLISLARISNTMLNRSGDSGQTCLVPDFRGKTFNLSLKGWACHIWPLFYWCSFILCPICSFFNQKTCWILTTFD